MKSLGIFFLFLVFFSPLILIAQQWSWAQATNDTISEPWLEVLHHDTYNNIYLKGTYTDTIYLQDTAFFHENYHGYYKVIAKYSQSGKINEVIDFYGFPNKSIHQIDVSTDQDNNLYVIGDFVDRVFFQDTVLVHGPTPVIESPELFLTKLDAENKVVWADVISGSFQDAVWGIFHNDDNDLLICTEHMANANSSVTVYFFDEDTTTHYGSFVNISKIDENKNILWRKEIGGSISVRSFEESNNQIKLMGSTPFHIIIEGDTIYNPNYGQNNPHTNFIMTLSMDGQLLDITFDIYHIFYAWSAFADNGEMFFAANIQDTTIINDDTIIVPPNNDVYLVGKLNSNFEMSWYKLLKKNIYGVMFSYPQLIADGNNLIMSISASNDFLIGDSLISADFNNKIFMSEINTNGELVSYTLVNKGHSTTRVNGLIMDNCKDIIISGNYTSRIIFNEDTVSAISNPGYFMAKLQRQNPIYHFLGPDTTSCDSILISAPEGYLNYIWNDSLTNSNIFPIDESNEITVTIGDENNCWQYDTIQIQIDEGFEIDLGADTSIFGNDTIYLRAFDELEEYLWSDGSSLNQLEIVGNNYGIGEFPIWVQAIRGVCSFRDTLILTVEQGFGIDDIINETVNLYPNPSNNQLVVEFIENDWMNLSYSIYNINGKKQKEGKVQNKSQLIDVEDLEAGLYLLLISDPTKKKSLLRKFVKE